MAAPGAALGFLPLPLLMEYENDRQDDERRQQGEAGSALDLPRHLQQIADGAREDDDQGQRETAEQDPVLPRHQVHGSVAL